MDKTVICYIEKDNKYLMLYRNKKQNDLNGGKWIGIGGHVEDEETYDQAILREVKEETNLQLKSFKKRGVINFTYDDFKEIMVVYTSDEFEGELGNCDEGDLFWIEKDKIFSLNLWEGDKIFLDYLINDKEYFNLDLIYEKGKLKKVNRK